MIKRQVPYSQGIVSECGLTVSDQGLDRLSKGLPQELVDVAGEEAFEALALALHVMKTIIDTSGIDDSGVLSTLNLALDLSRNILLSFEIKDSGELQEVSLAFHAFRDALISEHIDDDGDKVRKADDSNKQPSRPSKRPRTDDSGVMGMDDSIETASRPSKRLRTKKPDKRQAYAFTYNIKQPIMHSEYQQIMTNFEDNVGGFISTGNMYPDDSGSSRENGLSSTLRSCFRSNSCTSELDKVTKLKACFIMLTLYDLAMLYKPTDTGSLRPTMFHDIKEQIKRMGFNEDLELGKVAKWALMGKGINALCKEFGDGCLLYLANHMPLDL